MVLASPAENFVRLLLCRLRAMARELLPGAILPKERIRMHQQPDRP
jgi:hypothetical protein